MKPIILLITLISSIYFCGCNQSAYYNACDSRWAKNPSWTNQLRHRNDTICEGRYKDVGFDLDGWCLTALASALTSKGLHCKGYGECTPGVVNDILTKYQGDERVFQDMGIAGGDNYGPETNVQELIDSGHIVVGTTTKINGMKYAFAATGGNSTHTFGVDNFGNDKEYLKSEINGLVVFNIATNPSIFLNFLA
jgi:hypothetical protein